MVIQTWWNWLVIAVKRKSRLLSMTSIHGILCIIWRWKVPSVYVLKLQFLMGFIYSKQHVEIQRNLCKVFCYYGKIDMTPYRLSQLGSEAQCASPICTPPWISTPPGQAIFGVEHQCISYNAGLGLDLLPFIFIQTWKHLNLSILLTFVFCFSLLAICWLHLNHLFQLWFSGLQAKIIWFWTHYWRNHWWNDHTKKADTNLHWLCWSIFHCKRCFFQKPKLYVTVLHAYFRFCKK